jgi:phosphoenolpyruvate carboxykinase (ATP)
MFQGATDHVNYDDGIVTENTRVSYPLSYIRNAVIPSIGNIPKNIFFLACDAHGVLPPISRLTPSQAMYQFISGYTAKVAGTETGITEPKSTFSACFGAPFMLLHPGIYAAMLGKKIRENQVAVWLVNTGWSGGPYGSGSRIKLSSTRSMIAAALGGKLNEVAYAKHPVFNFEFPLTCPDVETGLLDPRKTWPDAGAYDEKARNLAGLFIRNFEKYKSGVSEEIGMAGPSI